MSSPEMHHGALGREGGEGIVHDGGRGKGGADKWTPRERASSTVV